MKLPRTRKIINFFNNPQILLAKNKKAKKILKITVKKKIKYEKIFKKYNKKT